MVTADTIDITIRPMIEGDVDAVHEIEVKTFPDPWPKEAFAGELGEKWSACFVTLYHGEVVGYLCAAEQEDELHIHNIAVSAAYQRRRIGWRLLIEAENWACRKGKLCAILDVRESSRGARTFYESAGYTEIGRRLKYYGSPTEDALVLMKVLPGAANGKV